ncbi:ABC transporter substrate-binding protein [Arthrobacter sp. 2YAF22_2]|uniref:ABC transporter substrate-binding protein n=1 Tax=Arthrobacter sp. 2YAF22_2 TaxID=3233029 RepID=UPI003F92CE91
MSHPIDVGSVLGGRYKVTATVLTSHDQDLVLDGVDQVLNRPVSILVAGPGNADQVAQSAREVATGERPGHVQILDLGVSDAATYLITNHTSAADLLDLVVSSNPPYVEPFFTDTLGSEIFGQTRSTEPETYDGLYADEEVDAGYINYGEQQRQAGQRPQTPSTSPQRVPAPPAAAPARGTGARGAAAAGAAGAAAGAAAASAAKSPKTAPQAAAPRPAVSQTAAPQATSAQPVQATGTPKVSLWEDDDYDDAVPDQRTASRAAAAGSDRAAGNFPVSAKQGAPVDSYNDYEDDGEDDEPEREPRSMRWLVGALLAAVLVIGLIFAVTNLGGLFKGSTPVAGKTTGSSSTQAQSATPSSTPSPSAPAAVAPAIESVTRQGNFDFAATYDGDLVKTFDGNAASYWSDMEFATDSWGGFAPEGVPLVVKLKAPSQITSVTLSQLGAAGGNISVFTNSQPSLDGAKQVGNNSFTSPELTMPLQEPVTAQYVIISIKTLPKLAAPKTRYGFGLRLAEIKVQ